MLPGKREDTSGGARPGSGGSATTLRGKPDHASRGAGRRFPRSLAVLRTKLGRACGEAPSCSWQARSHFPGSIAVPPAREATLRGKRGLPARDSNPASTEARSRWHRVRRCSLQGPRRFPASLPGMPPTHVRLTPTHAPLARPRATLPRDPPAPARDSDGEGRRRLPPTPGRRRPATRSPAAAPAPGTPRTSRRTRRSRRPPPSTRAPCP